MKTPVNLVEYIFDDRMIAKSISNDKIVSDIRAHMRSINNTADIVRNKFHNRGDRLFYGREHQATIRTLEDYVLRNARSRIPSIDVRITRNASVVEV